MDVKAFLTSIAGAVNDAELSGNTLQVTATRFIPSAPEPPHFYPFHWRVVYDRTYAGQVELTTTWHLLLSRAEEESALEEASDLSGTGENTIRAAVEAARKTGTGGRFADDSADDAVVRSAEGPRLFDFGSDAHFWGVEFTIFALG